MTSYNFIRHSIDTGMNRPLFIVGNGPSLQSFDFEMLKSKPWIGMNAAYRHWSQIGSYPTYYCCLDSVVAKSHRAAILNLINNADEYGIEKFLIDDSIKGPDIVSERVTFSSELFDNDPELSEKLTTGSHATYWGASLGFKEINLLGIDLNYIEIAPGLEPGSGTVLKVARDNGSPNYYFSDYQRVGDQLNIPNPVPGLHQMAWARVIRRIQSDFDGVTILNHSPVSSISGTIPIENTDFATQEAESIYSDIGLITLPERLTLGDAMSILLPKRFVELQDDANILGQKSSWHWKTIHSNKWTNRGRWLLQVVTSEQSSLASAPLASQLIVSSTGQNSLPNLHRKGFDQIIELSARNVTPSVFLALKLDVLQIDSAQSLINRSRWLSLTTNKVNRFLWRLVRIFDPLRPNRD